MAKKIEIGFLLGAGISICMGAPKTVNITNKLININDGNILLMGTYNKMLSYLNSYFIDTFLNFYKLLNKIDYFFISGYSFNDKGINIRVRNFIDSQSKKTFIIHPEPDNLKINSRGIIYNNWDRWEVEEKIIVKKCKFEDFNWDDISII